MTGPIRFVPAPARAHALVALSYAVALGAAWATVALVPAGWDPIARLALADLAATVAIFAFSRAFDNSSFYDAYWSLAPMAIALHLAVGPGATGDAARRVLVVGLVWAWGLRLTWNWIRTWEGLHQEDWRYVHFRRPWGRAYWAGSFGAFHLFPTVMTFLGVLPLFSASTSRAPLGALDLAAAAVTLAAITIEAVSDRHLRVFREAQRARGGEGAICDAGLWRWSRHPNYFGECTFWLGLWIFGVATAPERALWTAAGFVGIVVMFVTGTIPMMERRSLERRPGFAEHQRRVSMLVPWFRRS